MPQKITQNTNYRVLLACVTLNFMDIPRPMPRPWELLTQELTRPRSSPRPCKHRNQLIVKRSLACTHLCECQKVQNDVSLTYSLATSRTLQNINMSTEGEASASRPVCPSHKSQNGVISG